MRLFYLCPLILLVIFASACSTPPSVNRSAVSVKDAEVWLNRYCSKFQIQKQQSNELSGELIMRSNTREFKGQYPASLRFEKSGVFQMEMTSILGGTLMRLIGNTNAIIIVPSKPQFSRKGVTEYMGLSLPILAQLLHGDLPCPSYRPRVETDGSSIVLQTPSWKWVFERASDTDGLIPIDVRLVSAEQSILMKIEEWDVENAFAKKVSVKSVDGELKWMWRARDLK
jgi:hypothetical protein